MHKPILALLLLLVVTNETLGQKTSEDDYASTEKNTENMQGKIPFRDRLVFGGNLGGYFGNTTYLQANPMVGYRMNNWWVNGVGLNLTYISSNGYQENMYGASVWSRAYVLKTIIAHSEFELLRREASDQFGNSASIDVPVWLVGAGYSSGGRIGFSAMIMYDLIQDPNSPYSNPIFRVGGLFGF
jgi:putative transposon-encoded protein